MIRNSTYTMRTAFSAVNDNGTTPVIIVEAGCVTVILLKKDEFQTAVLDYPVVSDYNVYK